MELLVALGALVLVDVLALRYGHDSRPVPLPKDSPVEEWRSFRGRS